MTKASKRFIVERCCICNGAGRIDRAVVWDTHTPAEKVNEWWAKAGTPSFGGWMANPAIVAIFRIDPCDPDQGGDEEKLAKWIKAHEGEWAWEDEDEE